MFYIFTADYYLWLGLSSLLHPLHCQWNGKGTFRHEALKQITNDDIIIFDATSENYPAINAIHQQQVFPRFVYLKYKTSISLELLINSCEVIHKNAPINKIRAHILTAERAVQKQRPKLSAREALSLSLSITGLTIRQISEMLGTEEKTIYTCRRNACRKLRVRKVGELISFRDLLLRRTADTAVSGDDGASP